MLQQTRGIVLRTTPFSETSLIVWVYTEHFGLQKYMQKGARRVGKKGGSSQQVYYQPAALLDMVVYHRQQANFELIKEVRWHYLYQTVFSQVSRHAVALFMVEILAAAIKQPEANADLFDFVANQLRLLDEAQTAVVALLPAWFVLHLAGQMGFGLDTAEFETNGGINLYQGMENETGGAGFVSGVLADAIQKLANMPTAITLYRVKLNRLQRQQLLQACLQFLQFHQPDLGRLRSVEILEAILS